MKFFSTLLKIIIPSIDMIRVNIQLTYKYLYDISPIPKNAFLKISIAGVTGFNIKISMYFVGIKDVE